MNADALRAEIRRLGPWHHDVQIAPGVWTARVAKDVEYPERFGTVSVVNPEQWMARLIGEVLPAGFEGRSVLDCACNAGGFLFAAARHGASRGYGFDVRDHWINQARFLAEHIPGHPLEFATADIHSLPRMQREPFDITLFMGIFYHLPDPVASLRVAADLTKELLVLNTAYLGGRTSALVLNEESETDVMSGVHRVAWLPASENVLRRILGWCGFPHTRVTFRRRPHVSPFHRIEILAARDEKTFAHFDACRPDAARPPREGWARRLLRRRRWRWDQ